MPRHATQAQWLEKRTTGIGASDAAAVLGLNPWCGRFETWAVMTGRMTRIYSREQEERFMIAHLLEDDVVEMFKHRTGGDRKIVNPGRFTTKQHPEHDWLYCTTDFYQHDPERGRGILEVKTAGEYSSSDWEHSIPLAYQVQIQEQMACTGLYWGTVAAIIGGNRLKMYDIERDDGFIESMIANLELFWTLNVLQNYPPPIDASDSTGRTIQYLHPKDNGERVRLSDLVMTVTRYDEVNDQLRELNRERDLLVNLIKGGMEDATFLDLPDGSTFTYKHYESKGYTVNASEGRALRRQKAKKG